MNLFAGIKIIESPYAVETVHVVKRWPTKKKRRGYFVSKETRPCMYMLAGGTAVLHPSHMAKLRSMK